MRGGGADTIPMLIDMRSSHPQPGKEEGVNGWKGKALCPTIVSQGHAMLYAIVELVEYETDNDVS